MPLATQKRPLRSAVRTLDAFLITWRDHGLQAAADQYLTVDEGSAPRAGTLRLLSSKIGHTEITSWESANRFTFLVDLDLHFAGDPMAWNEGVNTRFVTVSRPTRTAPFRLAFATSP